MASPEPNESDEFWFWVDISQYYAKLTAHSSFYGGPMKRYNYWFMTGFFFLLVAFDLGEYIKIRNFHDFEETGYRETLKEPTGPGQYYKKDAVVRIPFTIINLSGWMKPYHALGAVIAPGMYNYRLEFTLDPDQKITGNDDLQYITRYLGASFFDHHLAPFLSQDLHEAPLNIPPGDQKKFIANYHTNLREHLVGMVWLGRLVLVFLGNLAVMLAGYLYFAGLRWHKRAKLRRKEMIRKAWELHGELVRTVDKLAPQFQRAWQFGSYNPLLIGAVEVELNQRFREATGLAIHDWNDPSMLSFYSKAREINLSALRTDVQRFAARVDDWSRRVNFEGQKSQAKIDQLKAAKEEFERMTADFKQYSFLSGNKDYKKLYQETARSLEAIREELERDKVHDKRFIFVRNSLKELKKALTPA